ncbi:MAG TPA: hypothetical protein VIM89_02430 [Mucilaginibacter sp.]
MKSIPKALPIFLVSIVLIFMSLQSFAQPRGMTMNQVYREVNRQTMNQQLNMRMAMNTNWRNNPGTGSDKYTVVFKDSTVKKVVSLMYTDTVLHKNFLVFVDKNFPKSDTAHRYQKIYSDNTKSISTDDKDTWGAIQYGTPNDSCWTFKVISGSLTVYARTAGYLMPTGPYSNDFDLSAITGLQLDNGPIEKFSPENLEKMVGQNQDALNDVKKKKYYKAVKKYNRDAEKAAAKK